MNKPNVFTDKNSNSNKSSEKNSINNIVANVLDLLEPIYNI
jgi:hypothetical protein